MFKDDAARLEQVVRESFLTVGRLEDSEAVGVAEASVEPASDHQVRQHVDLIRAKLWLIVGLLRKVSRCTFGWVSHALRRHHEDLHHGTQRVRHLVSTDHETLEDLVHDALTHIR